MNMRIMKQEQDVQNLWQKSWANIPTTCQKKDPLYFVKAYL